MRVMIRHRIANLLLFIAFLCMEAARALIQANERALSSYTSTPRHDLMKPWLRYGEDSHG